jgi:phospholipid transport system substrate-binding protein
VFRMPRRLFAALATTLVLSFALGPLAWAGAATDVVRTKQTKLFEALRKPKSPAADQEVAALFDEMLNYRVLAEASLGKEWAGRTEAERAQFEGLLKQLVQRAYERNLRKTLDYEIKYLGEEPQAAGATKVLTKAVHKTDTREEPIEINFRMGQRAGAWRVEDIETEGVSLVDSYRSQFTKILKKDGWDALIKKMQDKIAKGQ